MSKRQKVRDIEYMVSWENGSWDRVIEDDVPVDSDPQAWANNELLLQARFRKAIMITVMSEDPEEGAY